MTAITIGRATATIPAASANRPKAATKSFFARVWEAFVKSRMRQAEREIAMHRHLLPAELQDAGLRLSRSEKDLPFAR